MTGTPGKVAGGDSAGSEGEVRDHLANERTYLAWLRTGMALLGLGFLVARLRLELAAAHGTGDPTSFYGVAVGLGFAALGLLTTLFGTWRYLAVRRMIERRAFAPMGAAVLLISIGAIGVAVAVILYLLERLL
jgi:putative membrane protein